MITVNSREFSEDLARIERELKSFRQEIPFAMVYTLTLMGVAAKKEITKGLPKWFDRPTRWTMGSILLDPATKEKPDAKVWIKDGSINSLAHHISGGKRPAKRFERNLRTRGILRGSNQYAVPGSKARLNASGNMTMASLNKIMAAVGAHFDPRTNTSSASLKRNRSQGDYFVVQRQKGTPPGIYRRAGGKSNPRLEPILIFVRKTTYRRRFPFFEVGEDAAYDAMPAAMDRAIDNAFRHAFKKRR